MSAQRALAAAPAPPNSRSDNPGTNAQNDTQHEIDTALDRNESEEPTVLDEDQSASPAISDEDQAEPTQQATEKAVDSSATSAPAGADESRQRAAARVRQSNALPPALRERIARLVEASGDPTAEGVARVPIDAFVEAVEQSLPESVRSHGSYERPAHPGGEAFFQTGQGLSDDDAQRIAHAQLRHSGLLRGQRSDAKAD